jgi:cytochrome c oxidase subunit I+III
MSLGFTTLFVSALLEVSWIALLGAAITLVALVGWFWPLDTESTAIAELYAPHGEGPGGGHASVPTDAPSPAPTGADGTPAPANVRFALAVGDRSANGYWGTWVLLAIIATALATLVAGYVYLGSGPSPVSAAQAPPLGMALWAASAAVLAAATSRWLTHTIDEREAPARRWPLFAAFVLYAVLGWLAIVAWRDTGLDAASSGYASSVLALLGYAGLVALGAAGMLVAALLWAWLRPHDPRGRGVALNSSLICYASTGVWLVAIGMVHVWPRLAG